MLEGVLRMAELTAGKVMVAAARTDLINIDASLDETMHQVIDTAHSRFPVFEGERDNIIGILLAKDLLKLQRAPALNIRTLLRPPVFIPESKGLNDLLRDFRNTRNHMALVVDEFGRVAGLITIEDVLEQIVGDIEDEFDEQDDAGDIYALVDGSFRVSGDTAIDRVEEAFETTIFTPDEAEPQENRFCVVCMKVPPPRTNWGRQNTQSLQAVLAVAPLKKGLGLNLLLGVDSKPKSCENSEG